MLLKTKNLSKKYKNKLAVNKVNLELKRGSFVTLLGTNGAGKSTLINMLVGLKQPTSGEMITDANTKIGVVFQNSVLDPELTVYENLVVRVHQYKNCPLTRINELESQLGLRNFVNQRYGTLSGGQKRRVDIARALLNNPDILFLDEPTTGLDVQTRTAIWKLILKLQKQQQLTILLTTHYLEEAKESDYCYVLAHGQIIASGTTQEIIKQHAENQLHLQPTAPEQLITLLNQLTIPFEQEKCNFLIKPASSQQALQILEVVKPYLAEFSYSPGDISTAFMNITGWEVA
ncbi:ABC transporter ATP-binding protein [Lactobacillus sp. ESL0731]|uniref:ABC transporter ATP-binding protein n=1 Tax=unclassified Lactobacillus TaxID=2620435 RepID=UPI0023F6EF81|nr:MULTISPECIES: ABC transporter ATP-binding protein [unclassified Lactobacillus]WEV50634.1 ABC transporter ATP-binding protein [Lactobacillus sp. ESL0700]WEV61764.1 ABC transporter ATP-binding protein [Lactobacillus sp. ESL0731]